MMTLPEFKAWVDGMLAASPMMAPQLLNQMIQDKLKVECSTNVPPFAQNLTKGWVNRSDRVAVPQDPYIMGPWGPEQPM